MFEVYLLFLIIHQIIPQHKLLQVITIEQINLKWFFLHYCNLLKKKKPQVPSNIFFTGVFEAIKTLSM